VRDTPLRVGPERGRSLSVLLRLSPVHSGAAPAGGTVAGGRPWVEEDDAVDIHISVDRERVADFCRRHRICTLAMFGSVLRDDFDLDSDVDVLVQFEERHTPGWELFELEQELSGIVRRRVDLNAPGFLSRSFRGRVLDEAQVLYAA